METKRINSPTEAAEILRAGGLVAFPTETVFGLGVDATNEASVNRLFQAKGRPSDNPLIVHLAASEAWDLAASSMTAHARQLLSAFSPGPLTVVLPKSPSISSLATAGLDTVGMRIPDHPVALEILRRAGLPIAAPSANRSGRPSGTTWRSVLEDLDGRVDAVYCEDAPCIGIESTVVDCCGDSPVVLRPGAISLPQIQQVIPNAIAANAAAVDANRVASPGLLHPHYQPRAKVILFRGEAPNLAGAAYCGLRAPAAERELAFCRIFASVDDYAAGFYEFLREADRRSISTILVEPAPEYGIGAALLDRQRRAGGG